VSRLVYTSGCIEVLIDSRYRWMPSLTKLSGPKYKLAHATPGVPEFVAGLVYERTIEPDPEVADYSAEKIKDGDFFFVSESNQIVSHFSGKVSDRCCPTGCDEAPSICTYLQPVGSTIPSVGFAVRLSARLHLRSFLNIYIYFFFRKPASLPPSQR
jgi:hypothetical protein